MNEPRDHSEGQNSNYRLYEFGDDNRICGATSLAADTDDDAIEQARRKADGRVLELWDRSRLILRLLPRHHG